ncbi:ferredoxin [Nostocales cyanobacterium HT-58-2]|nr:ferredoxin [Nostocales cyanobacterium HT-58-2]
MTFELSTTTKPPANKCPSIFTETLGLSKIHKDTFICAIQTVSKRFSKQARFPLWEDLKKRLKQRNLQQDQESYSSCIFGNKVNCLPVWCSKLIIEDSSDAVRYRPTTSEIIKRIIREHLLGNKVVEEYALFTQPLPESSLVSREQLIKA